MPTETHNALITHTMLGVEDHGILTFWLTLDYGGSGQGAGGWVLDEYDKGLGRRVGTTLAADVVLALLKTLRVGKWEDLPGTHVRVRRTNTKVEAIGHIMRDDWLDFEAFFAERREDSDDARDR